MSEKRKKKEARRSARRGAKAKKRSPNSGNDAALRAGDGPAANLGAALGENVPPGSRRDAHGKTHLVVHRDAQGRPARLALSRPVFQDGWQNDVALAAASTAQGLVGDAPTAARVAELARSAMAATSRLVEGVLANAPDNAVACRAGCSHCCHQAVGVSAPEVFAIHRHLVETRSPEELESITERVRVADEQTRGLSSTERLSPDLPCPFLERDRCTIYEARPLACRGKNSLDAAACDRTLRDPEARAQLVAGILSVPCYLEPIRAFHAVAAGLQLSLHELHGLSMAPLELTAALRILLDDPETVTARWLAGEDPFSAARGGDATGDPRIRQLSGRA